MAAAGIHIGIGGWTYEPWRGAFYPEGLAQSRELAYVGDHLTATEINATFYGRQRPTSFVKWRDSVPDGFVFALKGSRYCTNRKNLAEAGESVANFVNQGLVELGEKLGPINWQLAATKHFDADEIAAFLALLPPAHEGVTLRHALEARHESFDDPAFFALCRKAGVAVVLADSTKYAALDATDTAAFVYARLQNAQEDQAHGYSAAKLNAWAKRVRGWADAGQTPFVFFINGFKPKAPAAAMALIERCRD